MGTPIDNLVDAVTKGDSGDAQFEFWYNGETDFDRVHSEIEDRVWRLHHIIKKLEKVVDQTDLVWQPHPDAFPEDMHSFEVFESLELAVNTYPKIPMRKWRTLHLSDIEDPTILE